MIVMCVLIIRRMVKCRVKVMSSCYTCRFCFVSNCVVLSSSHLQGPCLRETESDVRLLLATVMYTILSQLLKLKWDYHYCFNVSIGAVVGSIMRYCTVRLCMML
jgi:hypothetical protein